MIGRRGFLQTAVGFTVGLLSGVSQIGCNKADGKAFFYKWTPTPGGVLVNVPPWLQPWPDLIKEAFQEIDNVGLPAGWMVWIELPVFFLTSSTVGPTLARGMTDHNAMTIYVGWRIKAYEKTKMLPALEWEASLAKLDKKTAQRVDLDAINSGTKETWV